MEQTLTFGNNYSSCNCFLQLQTKLCRFHCKLQISWGPWIFGSAVLISRWDWFDCSLFLLVRLFRLINFCWLGISVLLHVSFLLFPSFWYMALKSKCAKILVKHTGRSRNQREVWNGTGQSLFVVGKNLNLLGGFHLDPCAFMFKFMSAYG